MVCFSGLVAFFLFPKLYVYVLLTMISFKIYRAAVKLVGDMSRIDCKHFSGNVSQISGNYVLGIEESSTQTFLALLAAPNLRY
jgi:hypothetical protein